MNDDERLFPISLEEMIACAEREIGMRSRAYPRFVEQKKMLQRKADHEIACMRAIHTLLKNLQENPNAQT